MLPRSGPFLALAFLGGCNILLPYSSGAGDDRGGALDQLLSDGSRREGLRGDLPRGREAGCLVDRLDEKLATCAGGCGDANNPDCDGLPGIRPTGRDFFDGCNKLVFEEDFSTPPNSTSWFHPKTTYQGKWSWRCGWYEQTATGGTYPDPMEMAWGRAQNAAPLLQGNGPDYLVEARVQLGPIGNPNIWGVGIVARYSTEAPFANIVCELRVDKVNGNNPLGPLAGTPAVTNPDVRVETRVSAQKWDAGWPISRDSKAVGQDKQIYYLQLWYTNYDTYDPMFSNQCIPTNTCKAIICRVCGEDSCVRDGAYAFWLGNPASPDMSGLPKAPGSVGIRTYGRAASFDYIRVFALVNP